jgi:phosphotransferase system enzyme I (PtsI)
LAKSLGIPAIVGLEKATRYAQAGEQIIVDAVAGRVIFHPAEATLDRYGEYLESYQRYEARLLSLADQPAETVDGFRVDLAANIELPEEIKHIGRFGGHSIGLYRSEFLFMGGSAPSEEEQFERYAKALHAVGPKNYVIFRMLDLGGDKTIPALPTYEEANPFLGLRAMRLCMAHPDLFMTQMRALLRASAKGNARVMFPMIGSVEELRWGKNMAREAMRQLDARKVAYNPDIEFGIMVEIPGAALMADVLAKELSFFSIGTNDLIQYTLAVDRVNDLVAYLYNPYHPSVLRLIHDVITAAHRNGIVANLCGEMGSDPVSAIILLGMGIDELSMASSQIPIIKEVIRSFRLDTARDIAREVLAQRTSEDVKRVIEERILPVVNPIRMPKLELNGL